MKIKTIIASALLISFICLISGCGGSDKGTAGTTAGTAGTTTVQQ